MECGSDRRDGLYRASCWNKHQRDRCVFADAQGRLITVKMDQIAERKPQTTSIMPDNLAQTMTLQEFRDLVAFLWRRK